MPVVVEEGRRGEGTVRTVIVDEGSHGRDVAHVSTIRFLPLLALSTKAAACITGIAARQLQPFKASRHLTFLNSHS